jgi:hypothetical protein
MVIPDEIPKVTTFLPDRSTIQRLIRRAAELKEKDMVPPVYEHCRPYFISK